MSLEKIVLRCLCLPACLSLSLLFVSTCVYPGEQWSSHPTPICICEWDEGQTLETSPGGRGRLIYLWIGGFQRECTPSDGSKPKRLSARGFHCSGGNQRGSGLSKQGPDPKHARSRRGAKGIITCVSERVNVRPNSGSSADDDRCSGRDPLWSRLREQFRALKHARAPSRPGTNGGAQTERIIWIRKRNLWVSLQFFLCWWMG